MHVAPDRRAERVAPVGAVAGRGVVVLEGRLERVLLYVGQMFVHGDLRDTRCSYSRLRVLPELVEDRLLEQPALAPGGGALRLERPVDEPDVRENEGMLRPERARVDPRALRPVRVRCLQRARPKERMGGARARRVGAEVAHCFEEGPQSRLQGRHRLRYRLRLAAVRQRLGLTCRLARVQRLP